MILFCLLKRSIGQTWKCCILQQWYRTWWYSLWYSYIISCNMGFSTKILIMLARFVTILRGMIQKLTFMLDWWIRVVDIKSAAHAQNLLVDHHWLLLSIEQDGGISTCWKIKKKKKNHLWSIKSYKDKKMVSNAWNGASSLIYFETKRTGLQNNTKLGHSGSK